MIFIRIIVKKNSKIYRIINIINIYMINKIYKKILEKINNKFNNIYIIND
jgi:hypothetical protein